MHVREATPKLISARWLPTAIASAAALILLTPAGSLAMPPVFAPAEHYTSIEPPNAIAMADLDVDGDLDVVLNDGSFLGSGTGRFEWESWVGDFTEVALADLDVDGLPDLIGTVCGNNELLVHRGLGDGTFVDTPDVYSGFNCPGDIRIDDLDGDGLLDAVVLSYDPGELSILLGQGNGKFKPVGTVSVPDPSGLAVGDVDADGMPDAVVTHPSPTNAVSLLSGLGGGGFAQPVKYPVGDGPRAAVIEDLNSDGIADLAVSNGNTPEISILFGTGKGFSKPVNHPSDSGNSLVAADMTGDGILDLVVHGTSSVDVLVGGGSGTFSKPARSALNMVCAEPGMAWGPVGSGVVAGDFDADGRLDLAVANYIGRGMSVLLQQ